MVKTIVLFDAPQQRTRQQLDFILRAEGYAWLFTNARWSSSRAASQAGLVRRIRSRLRGHSYRILFLDAGAGRSAPHVRWIVGDVR